MKRTKKVKMCVNCFKETKKCDCIVKVIEILENCNNCDEIVDEFWFYCPDCGFKLKN